MKKLKHIAVKISASAFLGGAMLTVTPAFAVDTVTATLSVKGKLTPGACNVSFAGGGSIDYGNVAAANLSSNSYTPLSAQAKALNVVCGSLTNAYVSVSDTKHASALVDAEMKKALGNPSLTDTQVFGLGTAGSGSDAAKV